MHTDAQDDAALVAAARAGDRAALARLFERYKPMAHALCLRTLGDAAAADDALQEAALQAMLALDRLRQPARFGAWWGGIALNVCRGMLEKRQGEWSWDVLVGGRRLDEPVDPGPDPAAAAELRDLSARVRRAVDDLPRGQRAAVLLVYLAGLSHDEAADLLGTPAGAVKTRLHKARARLRRDLLAVWMEERMTAERSSPWVEVTVEDVRRRAGLKGVPVGYCVVLAEKGGPRRLPIWVGQSEARAMVSKLEGMAAPRPQSDVLTGRLLDAVGARILEARISRLADDVFFAAVLVEGPTARAEVDARPSDAINLALLAGVPIRADEDVMAKAAVVPDTDADGSPPVHGRRVLADEIREELRRSGLIREETARHRAAGYPEWDAAQHAARLDADARAALEAAEAEARRHNHYWLGTEHVLLGLLAADNPASHRLAAAGVTADAARAALEARIGDGERPVPGPLYYSPRLRLALGRAVHAAGTGPVGAEHVLSGLNAYDGLSAGILADLGVDVAALQAQMAGTAG